MTQYHPNLKTRYLQRRQPKMPPVLAKKAHYALAGASTTLRTVITRIENTAACHHLPAPAVGHLHAAVLHIKAAIDELPALAVEDNRRTT